MSGCRSEAGRLFQILGPASDQVRWSLLSQRLVDVIGQLVVNLLLHRKLVQATKKSGDMWSRRLAPIRKCAAAFWINCSVL